MSLIKSYIYSRHESNKNINNRDQKIVFKALNEQTDPQCKRTRDCTLGGYSEKPKFETFSDTKRGYK